MPFIGNKPSAVPLTSADIADSIITSAKIVDATIANADIANSTINLTTKVTGTLPVANGGIGLAAIGTSLQVLRTNTGATALEFATVSSGFTSGTAVATTSGTAFDFTGIPATTKLIIINFHEVSLTSGDNFYVQLGDSGGFETSGYISTGWYGGFETGYSNETTAFTILGYTNAATYSLTCFLSLVDSSTNTWVSSHAGKLNTTESVAGGGSKSLSDTLTQVRITRSGSNTFDAGKLNILYI